MKFIRTLLAVLLLAPLSTSQAAARGGDTPLTHREVFRKNALKVTLREPLAYDAALHAQAEKDKKYRGLIRETALTTTTEGASTVVSVPALNPWGILMVEKLR